MTTTGQPRADAGRGRRDRVPLPERHRHPLYPGLRPVRKQGLDRAPAHLEVRQRNAGQPRPKPRGKGGVVEGDHRDLIRNGDAGFHAAGDALAYLRESSHERLLVLAVRAPNAPVRIPAALLGLDGEAETVYGGAPPLRAGVDGAVTLPGDGPTFQVWRLA